MVLLIVDEFTVFTQELLLIPGPGNESNFAFLFFPETVPVGAAELSVITGRLAGLLNYPGITQLSAEHTSGVIIPRGKLQLSWSDYQNETN